MNPIYLDANASYGSLEEIRDEPAREDAPQR